MSSLEVFETIELNKLKYGDYIMLKNEPCIIIEKVMSKGGKHGRSKILINAEEIFSPYRHHQEIFFTDSIVQIPIVKKNKYLVCMIDKNHVTLQDENGVLNIKEFSDDEICNEIKNMYDKEYKTIVTIISTCGKYKFCDLSINL